MVRVKYVNPVGTGELDSYFQEQLAATVGEGIEVDVCHLELGAAPEGPFLPRLPFYMGVLFETLKAAEDDGYDAAVIGCSGDPGLFEARRTLRMPVPMAVQYALGFMVPLLALQHVTLTRVAESFYGADRAYYTGVVLDLDPGDYEIAPAPPSSQGKLEPSEVRVPGTGTVTLRLRIVPSS